MMTQLVRQNHLPNGIHEFIFMTDNREAIDFYFDLVGELFESSPKDRPICYIVDWSQSGVPNMNYMFLKTKEWRRKHRGVAKGRCVLLFDQKGFMPIGKALSMLIEKEWQDGIRIQLDHIDNRDKAIAWLLAQRGEGSVARQ